ncbi:MAG: HipA N-terminal domain-containing protein [Bacteroidota bacterium]
MRKAEIFVHGELAGHLLELETNTSYRYRFQYLDQYDGALVSLTMPIEQRTFEYDRFPPFFEGLLPEGIMLEGLLRQLKIDAKDYFAQLMATGRDLVGAVTVKAVKDE